MKNQTTDLMRVLKGSSLAVLDDYLKEYEVDLVTGDRPFTEYMRKVIREKGMRQQDVLIRADLPEHYGYKLISMERHTVQRDYILRLCLGAKMTVRETGRALRLYGMSELYPRIARDAILILAIHDGQYDIPKINELLMEKGEEPLRECGRE